MRDSSIRKKTQTISSITFVNGLKYITRNKQN